ncbi:MAG: pyridoxal 5'-phosphate synthase glutaminase subunit PdxT [Clostridia bacterium]|nr:pyridoxal 5'-phosphate synthase glutaminase subunit PdxT [Clostridia bacterium]
MCTIGVLALQGSVAEHMAHLAVLSNVLPREVKKPADLDGIDGLILPGGESTTLSRLIKTFGLFEPLRQKIQAGLPVWGTCAGLILLAREIVGEPCHLGVLNIAVRRNAFGRQVDSFRQTELIPVVSKEPTELVFIRAPWIEQAGPDVEILHAIEGKVVAVRQKYLLATAFHPELAASSDWHSYFADLVAQSLI